MSEDNTLFTEFSGSTDPRLDITRQTTELSSSASGDQVPPKIPDIEIISQIGQGGMGRVYRARQPYLDREVAVKVLLTPDADSHFTARFEREAKTLAGLDHPHIVSCYAAGLTEQGQCYLVMAFIEGYDLRQTIEENGPMPIDQALLITRAIAQALDHALQRGVIHRDVKPDNILLASAHASSSLPFTPKLVDLGLARPQKRQDSGLTRDGAIMGTPATMAPEQFDDPDSVDHRADIYGLGCVLYYMLTGKRAFPSQSLSTLICDKMESRIQDPGKFCPSLSSEVNHLVLDMLAARADDRPQTYQEIVERCDLCLHKQGSDSGSSKKKQLSLLIIGLCFVMLAVFILTNMTQQAELDTVNEDLSSLTVENEVKDSSLAQVELPEVEPESEFLPKEQTEKLSPITFAEPMDLFPPAKKPSDRFRQWAEKSKQFFPSEDRQGVNARSINGQEVAIRHNLLNPYFAFAMTIEDHTFVGTFDELTLRIHTDSQPIDMKLVQIGITQVSCIMPAGINLNTSSQMVNSVSPFVARIHVNRDKWVLSWAGAEFEYPTEKLPQATAISFILKSTDDAVLYLEQTTIAYPVQ